jgi:hypothetical protein
MGGNDCSVFFITPILEIYLDGSSGYFRFGSIKEVRFGGSLARYILFVVDLIVNLFSIFFEDFYVALFRSMNSFANR